MQLLVFTSVFVFVDVLGAIHLPIYRRGGRLVDHSLADLTQLSTLLHETEAKYARTRYGTDSNRITRNWETGPLSKDDYMFDIAGHGGTWYAKIEVGYPSQTLEIDLDMLSPDFYTIMTSSGHGSKYDTFHSSSREVLNSHPHDMCRTSSELFELRPSIQQPVKLEFPICQPPKFSHHTLQSSGTVLGLAPPGSSRSLSRLSSPTFLEQLLSQQIVSHNIFSLTILDSETGLLSFGETAAVQIEETKIRTEKGLKYLDSLDSEEQRAQMEQEVQGAIQFSIPAGSTHEDHFKWTDVGRGAVSGWHMTLMTGVWVNGVKVLKNQPVLFDINCPFILAPPIAARTLYHAVPGARSVSSLLQHHEDVARSFHAWPCLVKADIEFEIAGWRFPVAKSVGTRGDDLYGPTGGAFSLGQVDVQDGEIEARTGYCVGIVVETEMGLREEWSRAAMKDVWVLGEPFFRKTGVTFDLDQQRIGLRVF